jgi:hypothetical protein
MREHGGAFVTDLPYAKPTEDGAEQCRGRLDEQPCVLQDATRLVWSAASPLPATVTKRAASHRPLNFASETGEEDDRGPARGRRNGPDWVRRKLRLA